MECVKCHRPVSIKNQFCPNCGARVEVAFEQIESTIQVDAAARHVKAARSALLWIILALGIVGALLYGLNYLWDRPLVYDDSIQPAVDAPTVRDPSSSGP